LLEKVGLKELYAKSSFGEIYDKNQKASEQGGLGALAGMVSKSAQLGLKEGSAALLQGLPKAAQSMKEILATTDFKNINLMGSKDKMDALGKLAAEVANPRIRWAYLPYAMHMAGPREALQHMIIRKNYGCTHFIIGRDMAGCKSSLSGEDFYGPYDAQDFARDNAPELGMETVPSLNLVYTEEVGYVTAEHAEARGLHVKKLSGTQFRQMLRSGEEIPEWFAFRSVVEVLRSA
jgi:hypothetical protein